MSLQDEVNVFLDRLRETGLINMFGAPAYVQEAFEVSKSEARTYVTNWMDTFSERHPKG